MGIYSGTDANETITPDAISASVIALPLGSRPGAGPDTLFGNGGDDVLDGGAGADTLYGGTGNDTYVVDDPGDVLTGDDISEAGGIDSVLSSISYTLNEGLENLTLQGSAAIDGRGNESDNTLIGNSSDNVLKGFGGADTLIGKAGADNLIGGQGDDVLKGGADADQLIGGAGIDLLNGGGGDDALKGGTDDDTLLGLGESDTLKGNAGNDKLDGGKGVDTLAGGGGDDQFIFAKPNQGGDLIRDFRDRVGNSDSIVIDTASFKGGLEAGDVSDEQFQTSDGHDAQNSDVRFILDTSDNTLWFDKNGDGAGGLKLIADLQVSANLEADNIFLV